MIPFSAISRSAVARLRGRIPRPAGKVRRRSHRGCGHWTKGSVRVPVLSVATAKRRSISMVADRERRMVGRSSEKIDD